VPTEIPGSPLSDYSVKYAKRAAEAVLTNVSAAAHSSANAVALTPLYIAYENANGEPADVRSQWITGFTYRESGVASTARVEILQCVKQRNDTGLRFNPSSYFQWL
jgi:hypothetical protein